MLWILEIGLTVWAWKRGWRGWALLPLTIGLGASFLSGFYIGFSGGSEENLENMMGLFLLMDVAVIVSLVLMVIFKRGRKVVVKDSRAYRNMTSDDGKYQTANVEELSPQQTTGVAQVPQVAHFCAQCGSRLQYPVRFCAGCGMQVGASSPTICDARS